MKTSYIYQVPILEQSNELHMVQHPMPVDQRRTELQQQISALHTLKLEAIKLHNSRLKSISIWITADSDNEVFTKVVNFPNTEHIPEQAKQLIQDYALQLIRLEKQLENELLQLESAAA